MDCSGDRIFALEILWTIFYKLCHLPPHPPSLASHPPTPLAILTQNWCTPSKNNLKWPQIKQVTNSKLHYNKANRLLNPAVQKIVGFIRAKAIKILKTGIYIIITRCELGRFSRGQSHTHISVINFLFFKDHTGME